jgi:hypothetical protein
MTNLTKTQYEQLKAECLKNGIAIRVTAYHGNTDTYDVQMENPYQVYVKHFSHLSVSEINEKALQDIKNY